MTEGGSLRGFRRKPWQSKKSPSLQKHTRKENAPKRVRFAFLISSRTEAHDVVKTLPFCTAFRKRKAFALQSVFPLPEKFSDTFREPYFYKKARRCKNIREKKTHPNGCVLLFLSLRELRRTTSFLQAVLFSFLCARVAG